MNQDDGRVALAECIAAHDQYSEATTALGVVDYVAARYHAASKAARLAASSPDSEVAIVFGMAVFGRSTAPLRGAATLYIVITGTVYHLVLTNPASPFFMVDPGSGTVHNFLLHTLTPILAAVDWFLVSREPVRWWYAAAWLTYPLAYLVFALIRGAFVHKYPYPFINADQLGYGGIAVNTLVFGLVFYLLGLMLIGAGALARRLRATEPGQILRLLVHSSVRIMSVDAQSSVCPSA